MPRDTEHPQPSPPALALPPEMLDMKSLVGLLIRHFGHHEGHFEAALQLAIALGPVAPGPSATLMPGAIFGVNGVGLRRLAEPTANSVDAAVVNPAADCATA